MELFHHFFTWTYRPLVTKGSTARHARFWQETLPVLASKHEYLLQSLLSFTSLHVAHLRAGESERYQHISAYYRDQALARLPVVLHALPLQTEACFWTSCFIGLIALADHNSPNGEHPKPARFFLLQLATLWRGGQTIANAGESSSSLSEVIALGHSPIGHMDETQKIIYRVQACIQTRQRENSPSSTIYLEAVKELFESYDMLRTTGSNELLLAWVACSDRQLLENMGAGELLACLVVIIYGVLLHYIRDLWFIQDMGLRLVQDVSNSMALTDREVVSIVNWARQQVCPP